MHPKVERCGLKLQELEPWRTAALVVLSGNWAASALSDAFVSAFSKNATVALPGRVHRLDPVLDWHRRVAVSATGPFPPSPNKASLR